MYPAQAQKGFKMKNQSFNMKFIKSIPETPKKHSQKSILETPDKKQNSDPLRRKLLKAKERIDKGEFDTEEEFFNKNKIKEEKCWCGKKKSVCKNRINKHKSKRSKAIKELVIARIKTMPNNWRLNIG